VGLSACLAERKLARMAAVLIAPQSWLDAGQEAAVTEGHECDTLDRS
jgi:hypothetical protein